MSSFIILQGETMRKATALAYGDRVKIHHARDERLLCDISLNLYWILVDKGYIIFQPDRYGYAN